MGRVLIISGSDSSGGAGLQADISACVGVGAAFSTVVTAITAQHSGGVDAIEPVSPAMIEAQFLAVLKQGEPIDAVKIGMLGSAEVVELVARLLNEVQGVLKNIVLDPVLVATSGGILGDRSTAQAIVKHLLPLATLITPNIDEAAELLAAENGTIVKIEGRDDCDTVWKTLKQMGAQGLLLKGGHAQKWQGAKIEDLLYVSPKSNPQIFENARIDVHQNITHGTGCTLSSALAAALALGQSLPTATHTAIQYVRNRIQQQIEQNLNHK